jgi:hypothetical protein
MGDEGQRCQINSTTLEAFPDSSFKAMSLEWEIPGYSLVIVLSIN